MSLPQLSVPKYELELPSSGQKVLFRPFTVREEKVLLMSIDGDEAQQVRALREVLDNCLFPGLDGKKLDVGRLAMFDLDYIWLKIRSKSVQEIVTLPFECQQPLPDGQTRKGENGEEYQHCGTIVNVPVNLDKIEVKKDPTNNPVITLEGSIGLKLKYPTFETVQKLVAVEAENDVESMFNIIIECIEMIFDGEKTYEKEHVDREELVSFLESLSKAQFSQIKHFFESLPVLRHHIHFRCPKCRTEIDLTLEGTKSFLESDSATTQ